MMKMEDLHTMDLTTNGPPKSSQHVAYLNWYVGPVAPTPHPTRKSLSYFIYKEGTNLDVHLWVFRKAIHANEEKDDAYIINLFFFLLYMTPSWNGERISCNLI